MAASDYYLCDTCNGKTFYDANLDYGFVQDEIALINANPETNHRWPNGDVGDMAVICKECAKTHTIMIRFDPDKPEKSECEG
jgi:hypothetical protein